MSADPTGGLSGIEALRAAKKKVAAEEATRAAIANDERQAQALRDGLRAEGARSLAELRTRLFSVLEDVPRSMNKGQEHRSGAAKIRIGNAQPGPNASAAPLDVVAWAPIELTCTPESGRPYAWSATLIFVGRPGEPGPRWMEVAFFQPLVASDRDAPFGLDATQFDFAAAMGPGLHTHSIAYGPVPIDGEDLDAFLNRWTTMFAKAMVSALSRPSSLPIQL